MGENRIMYISTILNQPTLHLSKIKSVNEEFESPITLQVKKPQADKKILPGLIVYLNPLTT